MLRLEWTAIYAGVNILILLVLALMVASGRRTHKIVLGVGDNPDFNRAVRAHANAAEYIPAGLVGILLLALLEPAAPLWLFHSAALSLTAGRIIHAVGLHTGALNAGRVIGMALTWLSFLLMGAGLVWSGLSQQL
ncbi:MAG TPA: MAPEG family protein [Vitreimonas sp.]|uniref:MAPEG family protein n=1 Tax=Vitreimonas sp. TaxID=3069702 RepID=UPI002D4B719A|nr:MAPEG family protein [Vitreimonas sp.]HYD87251.1 MAPEG family protein [Vitreimonas sp.]